MPSRMDPADILGSASPTRNKMLRWPPPQEAATRGTMSGAVLPKGTSAVSSSLS